MFVLVNEWLWGFLWMALNIKFCKVSTAIVSGTSLIKLCWQFREFCGGGKNSNFKRKYSIQFSHFIDILMHFPNANNIFFPSSKRHIKRGLKCHYRWLLSYIYGLMHYHCVNMSEMNTFIITRHMLLWKLLIDVELVLISQEAFSVCFMNA